MSNYTNIKLELKNPNSTWTKMFSLINDESLILDIGCSSGNFGEGLKKYKKCKVFGMDIDKDDVNRAKKVIDKAFVANIESDNLSSIVGNIKFDYVVMADVIEHLNNPVSALKKIKELIKPGGSLIFSIPNMTHITIRMKLLEGLFEYTETGILDKTHLHFYDINEVERVFREAGYLINQYDSTIVNYPRTFVREKLEKIGLFPEERFFDHLNSTHANIYQFVGSVSPNKQLVKNSHKNLRITSSPAEDINQHIQNLEKIWKDKEIQLLRQLNNNKAAKIKTKLKKIKSKLL